MKNILLAPSFEKLVHTNARVKPGEKVVIVTDFQMCDIAQQLAATIYAAGGKIVICTMLPREKDGQEPEDAIAAAMSEADVIFSPVSKSITHTNAIKSALKKGARAILMTAYNENILLSNALLKTDFQTQIPICYKVGDAFTAGSEIHLTSPLGTDLRFSIEGRKANVLTNVPEPGELAPVPDIEVNVVPVTGTASGKLVIDACVPYLGIGILREPIHCEVRKGRIITMEGGEQARFLKSRLDSYNDINCFNVAELGVGLNPEARLSGNMLEDEGIIGTIHIGIGTSVTLGGEIKAPMHYDLIMWNPTIEVDGKIIQKNKDILL